MRKSKVWGKFITFHNIKAIFAVFIVLFSFIFFILPFFLFWKDSVITVHDNLDIYIPWFKMFKENKMLFAFDVPTRAYSGLSYLYYTHSINLQSLIYYIADDFLAYAITNTAAIVLGFISMYYLLTKTFNISWFSSLCAAVCFSILPVYQIIHIAVESLPLITLLFFSLYNSKRKFSPRVFLLIGYPLLSYFAYTGIFILALWFLGTICCCIKKRKINYNLSAGLLVLVLGYIATDYRLFYIAVFLKEPLNRSIFNSSLDFFTTIKEIISCFVRGRYHAASLQTRIIFPLVILISVCVVILIYRSYIRQGRESIKGLAYKDNPLKKIILCIKTLDKKLKVFLCIECMIALFSIIAGIYDSGILNGLIKKYMPVLGGFNWGRFWILNRMFWYILFAISLELINREIQNHPPLSIHGKILRLPRVCPCLIMFFITLLQIHAVISVPVYYNDARSTWVHFKDKIQHYDEEYITYNEFYSEPLFSKIKEELSYKDEMVVAFGFHPAVLLYNGFNCIDGYNGVYPLSYMKRFRKLIEPEFLVNNDAMKYFDSWGGRCYIYNSELSYEPTRNKNTNAVNLNINMEIFTHDFNGKYIISRAEIKNAKALGVSLVGTFTDQDSIYTIFVYKNNNI